MSVVAFRMRPLSVLQTLWTTDSLRCVLVRQLQPEAYVVHVFDGIRAVRSELVKHPEEAGEVAATLWAPFIDRRRLPVKNGLVGGWLISADDR